MYGLLKERGDFASRKEGGRHPRKKEQPLGWHTARTDSERRGHRGGQGWVLQGQEGLWEDGVRLALRGVPVCDLAGQAGGAEVRTSP